jgi:hypothetical protein
MNTPKVLSVQALEGKKLLVKFANYVEKVYDCAPLCNLDRFRFLEDEAFFKSVKVDPGGYGISWNDDTDLSEYELWTNGIETAAVSA